MATDRSRVPRRPSAKRGRTAPDRGRPAQTDFRLLFESAPDPIIVSNGESRVLEANQAAVDLTGHSREALLTMHVSDLTPADQRDECHAAFASLRETGRLRGERTLLRKDGGTLVVDLHAVRLDSEHFAIILRDRTEQNAAAAAAERSRSDYATLLELCRIPVVSADADGRIMSWNQAATDVFGYSADEAVGMSMESLIPASIRRDALRAFRTEASGLRRDHYAECITTQAVRKGGKEFPVELSLAFGVRDNQEVFTAVIRDISAQQTMLERLDDALQRLQFHVDRMPLGYIVWDEQFRVVEWNREAERIFGYSKEEALGRHAYELIVPSDSIPHVDRVWAQLLTGDASSHSFNQNVCKDGRRITCEWFNTPLRDRSGAIRGAASMVVDISERLAMDARVRNAQKLESLGVLASGVAHDFNSSLMVILGNTALLRSTPGLSAKALDFLDLIDEAGGRSRDMVRHLLSFARTGRHNPQISDLNAIICDGLRFLVTSMGERHPVQLRLGNSLPPITADRSQVHQVLFNLCLNAKQAMLNGGPITITTAASRLSDAESAACVPYEIRPGLYVELCVGDSGTGIDDTTMQRIFDPFFTTRPDGHGLGLAAVLGILRQHGALIRYESQQGRGTRVHVHFPATESVRGSPTGS